MAYQNKKFFPPVVDDSIHLERPRLIRKISDYSERNHIVIEAQAGQGKSTFISQYLQRSGISFTWYQVGPEDKDVTYLVSTLYEGLLHSLPCFESAVLSEMIEKGELLSSDVEKYARLMARDLESYLTHDHVCVFDDLYFLPPDGLSRGFISEFVRFSGKRVRCILMTRYSEGRVRANDQADHGIVSLPGNELAMTRSEISELLNTRFNIPASGDLVQQIYSETEGWIIGVMTKAHRLSDTGGTIDSAIHQEVSDLNSYFKNEIFRYLPVEILNSLSKLSFTDFVPIPLAVKISGDNNISEILGRLVKKNYFTRYADSSEAVVVFHHLFKKCLNEYAMARLNRHDIIRNLTVTARWYLNEGDFGEAIGFFIKAGDYSGAETVIQEAGPDIDSYRNTEIISEALKMIPENSIVNHSWLSLFRGQILMNENPPEALVYLEWAEKGFTEKKDSVGKLIAKTLLIYYHVWVDCMFSKGNAYLMSAEELFLEVGETLSVPLKLKVLYSIACGFAFLESNIERSRHYSSRALLLSSGYDNCNAELRILQCYQYGFEGNWPGFSDELEKLLSLMKSERVSSYNRMLLWMTKMNLLQMKGDFQGYKFLKHHVRRITEDNLMIKGIFTPFIYIWDIDTALAEGETDLAKRLVEEAIRLPFVGTSPHMKSQFLHYKTLVHAIEGDEENTVKSAEESLNLRLEAGSPYFIMLTKMVLGGAYVRLGKMDKAETYLQEAVEISNKVGDAYERSGAYAYQALASLESQKKETMRPALARAMECLRDNKYKHFFSATPDVFLRLYTAAVQSAVEVDYAKREASLRFGKSISDDGDVYPVLMIKTLGPFSISLGNKTVLTGADLTLSQQKLIAMMISSPNVKVYADEVQALFWPEKDPKKARAGFDTMLSRLRKLLASAMDPVPLTHYFYLKNEQLGFKHARTDIADFIDYANQGIALSEKSFKWQAGNAFRKALVLWGGEFLSGFFLDRNVHKFKEYTLLPLFNTCTRIWSGIILDVTETIPEDIELLEKAVSVDSSNIDLVKNLYQYYCKHELSVKASRVIKLYRNTLLTDGFDPDEIDDAVESVWNN